MDEEDGAFAGCVGGGECFCVEDSDFRVFSLEPDLAVVDGRGRHGDVCCFGRCVRSPSSLGCGGDSSLISS